MAALFGRSESAVFHSLLVAAITLVATAPSCAQTPATPPTAPTTPAATSAVQHVVAVADASIKVLAFSRDGRTLVGGAGDHTIRTWDAFTGRPGPTLAGHSSAVNAILFTEDGKSLLSVANEILRWDVKNWQLAETVNLEKWQRPRAVRFSPDGKRLAAVAGDDQLLIYDVASGLQLRALKVAGAPLSLAFTPDGKSVAVGTMWNDATTTGGQIHFFKVATGELERSLAAHAASVTALAFSADGHSLACSSFQKAVVVNAQDGAVVKEFAGHSGPINAIAFSPDGNSLASGGSGPGFQMPGEWMLMSETRRWDMKTGRLLWANVGELAHVYSIAFSPDGALLARCDERTVLVQPMLDNGRSWVRYTSETSGIGRDMADARTYRLNREGNVRGRVLVFADETPTTRTKAQIQLFTSAIDAYKMTVNEYPTDLADLLNRPADAQLAKRWAGPYVQMLPKDAWGNDYRFASPGFFNPQSFDLSSAGPDGQQGTADDITNSKAAAPRVVDGK